MQPNIVQVEYSHVLKGARSIEDIQRMILERARDRSRSKTVVRFFDHTGRISSQAKQLQTLDQKRQPLLLLAFDKPGWLRRRWYIWRRSRLTKQIMRLRKTLEKDVLLHLVYQLEHGGPVAVEDRGGDPFRFPQKDEIHELLEGARAGTHPWFLVFEPNDLLADKVVGFAYALPVA